jgi:hypothetical protein
MVTDSSFARTPRRAVLDPIPFEPLDTTIVHPNRKTYLQNSLWVLDHISNVAVQFQSIRREIKILHGGVVRRFDRLI